MILSAATIFGATAFAACGTIPGGNSGGETKTSATIKFDINLSGYETNVVKDKTVSIGKKVPIAKAYVTGDNPDNLQLYGWYTDKACTDVWDFKKDRVEGDMTLYAKWVEQYDVNYYVNGEFQKSEPVFKGDKAAEDASLIAGFKYLGTYLDEECEVAFDYNSAITADTNLYMQRSEGIYMSDYVEEGGIAGASLSEYLVAYVGSYSTDAKGNFVEEEGWVETRTVATQTPTGIVQEQCSYVNFGYTPKYGDGYVELCLALDITESQIIRIWFKNLGQADSVNMYFTALLDAENNIYSETGAVYTQDFCYPNYTGSGVGGPIALGYDQIGMDETSDWTYVDFNLYEVYKNGYSIWGTASYLGMIRFQANYKNESEEDWSNEFLIKAIEGIPCDIVVEDSGDVKDMLKAAENTSPETLAAASAAQAENPKGLVFPKDFASLKTVTDGAVALNSVDGLLFRAENEIVTRENNGSYYGFTLQVPEGKNIDLAELTTLSVTVKNFSYVENLVVRVYNDIGIPVTAELKMAKRNDDSKTYTANLYGKYGMEGTLSKIEIRYNSIGVDNAVLFECIEMSEFVPYDIVGINLNDKNCFGLEGTDKVAVSFDSNRSGTLFNVSQSGASVTNPVDKTYNATSDGYGVAILQYYLHKDSGVTAVSVEYRINGKYTSAYTYQLDTENKGIVSSVALPLKSNERGFVKGIRLTFEGTGKVLIRSIDYAVSETGLPFYQSYADIYSGWDWELTNAYGYDNTLKASIFTKDPTQVTMSFALYIGISANMSAHLSIPHTTMNVLVTQTTKIKLVYQNKTDVNTLNLISGFANSELGNPDETGNFYEANGCAIDSNMKDYEWSTLTIEVPANRAGKYLGKIAINFAGKEIAIRAISIETGV